MGFNIGETVGRYRVLEVLGQGGMATVYRGYDSALDRDVAIKVMHQGFNEDPGFLARFQREAQIVARFRHPHIVAIHEYAQHGEQPYLVMEYIEGQTLKQRLSQKPLALEETVQLLNALGDALTYAHNQGVLHRDIKPSNILLDTSGKPYLTDFGLARNVQAGESTLSQDVMLGTPQYISPEQAQGVRDLKPSTDIYSLGIVLYQLVVGRVPFTGDTPYAIVHDHIYTPLPLPSKVNPAVPAPLEQVLLTALSKEAADRYQSAIDMARAFDEAVHQSRITRLPSPPPLIPAAAIEPAVQPAPLPWSAHSLDQPPSDITPITASLQRRKKRHAQLWMMGGLGAFIFTCLLGLLVAIFAVSNPANRAIGLEPLLQATDDSGVQQVLPDLTVEEARQRIADNPGDAAAHFALVIRLMETDQRIEARQVMAQAIELAQDDPELVIATANALLSQDHNLEALGLLVQSLKSTSSPGIRNATGDLLYRRASSANRLEARILANLVENQPDSPGAYSMLGRAYISTNQLAQAQDALAQALALDGTLPETHLVLGELYASQDLQEEAETEWRYAATASDSPEWVKTRAAELLGSTTPQ